MNEHFAVCIIVTNMAGVLTRISSLFGFCEILLKNEEINGDFDTVYTSESSRRYV